jgi:hypothetical protein
MAQSAAAPSNSEAAASKPKVRLFNNIHHPTGSRTLRKRKEKGKLTLVYYYRNE